jgi:hypothetical protein
MDLFFYISCFAPMPLPLKLAGAAASIEMTLCVLFVTNRAAMVAKMVNEDNKS